MSDHQGNRILALLGSDEASALKAKMTPVSLKRGTVLIEPDAPIEQVYLLDDGIISSVARSNEGLAVETGIIGREGVVMPSVALESDRVPYICEVQVPGHGYAIAREAFLRALEEMPALRSLTLRFAQAYLVQMAFSQLSSSVHNVEERLARWLLMCHDRLDSDDIAITHQYIATMLSVRRPSVTTALHVLEGSGFVESVRGCVTIRNRAALEDFASDSYGKPEAEYRRLLGPL